MMNPEEEENVRKIVREELAKSNNSNGNSQGKKKKSKWQLYLKDCLKEQPKGTALGDRVKGCSVEYKQIKDKLQISPDGILINPNRKEEIKL